MLRGPLQNSVYGWRCDAVHLWIPLRRCELVLKARQGQFGGLALESVTLTKIFDLDQKSWLGLTIRLRDSWEPKTFLSTAEFGMSKQKTCLAMS